MTKDELRQYIKEGHDIEWKYHDKWFSIIPKAKDDNGKRCISFCEFYQEPIDVYTFEELININYNGVTVMEMLESLGDEEDAEKRGDLVIY